MNDSAELQFLRKLGSNKNFADVLRNIADEIEQSPIELTDDQKKEIQQLRFSIKLSREGEINESRQ